MYWIVIADGTIVSDVYNIGVPAAKVLAHKMIDAYMMI